MYIYICIWFAALFGASKEIHKPLPEWPEVKTLPMPPEKSQAEWSAGDQTLKWLRVDRLISLFTVYLRYSMSDSITIQYDSIDTFAIFGHDKAGGSACRVRAQIQPIPQGSFRQDNPQHLRCSCFLSMVWNGSRRSSALEVGSDSRKPVNL